MPDEDKPQIPISKEVLDHKRKYDYDDQGKGFEQEAEDSMWIILYLFVALLVLAGVIIFLVVKG